MGKLIEGYWDCSSCGTRAIRGRSRECPNCGKPRGEETRFYMLDKKYVDENQSRHISRNPNWLCSFCRQLNSDSVSACKSCGASKSDSEENYFEMRAREDEKAATRRQFEATGGFPLKAKSSASKLKILGISVVIVLLLVLSVLGIKQFSKPKEVTVTGFSWEKSLEIEQYKTVTEDGWSLPSNARLTKTSNEIYTYEEVLDHYDTIQVANQRISGYRTEVTGYNDLGNGYFEEITTQVPEYETYYTTEQVPVYRQEPVYKTKYYYEIDRWVVTRTVDTFGSDKNDYIGEYVLSEPKDGFKLGEERTGNLIETYYIHTVNKKGKEHKYTVTKADWVYVDSGQTVNLKADLYGRARIIQE